MRQKSVNPAFLTNFHKDFLQVKPEIERRIKEFIKLREAEQERLLLELIFCLLTPQSKAIICWKCALSIHKASLNKELSEKDIEELIKGVRFKKNKARYIKLALEQLKDFPLKKLLKEKDSIYMREWLVKNVMGLGYKEASHFLRNTGFGLDLAILDRHILKNLLNLGVIEEIPKTLTKKRYLQIEGKFKELAKEINILPAELDLFLWYKETGFVFK